jgi:hypothetical protein
MRPRDLSGVEERLLFWCWGIARPERSRMRRFRRVRATPARTRGALASRGEVASVTGMDDVHRALVDLATCAGLRKRPAAPMWNTRERNVVGPPQPKKCVWRNRPAVQKLVARGICPFVLLPHNRGSVTLGPAHPRKMRTTLRFDEPFVISVDVDAPRASRSVGRSGNVGSSGQARDV